MPITDNCATRKGRGGLLVPSLRGGLAFFCLVTAASDRELDHQLFSRQHKNGLICQFCKPDQSEATVQDLIRLPAGS